MASWLTKLPGWLQPQQPRLICESTVWKAGVVELRRRTLEGRRESGAFLLGQQTGRQRRILDFIYYDDLDPKALATGIVHFDGTKYPKLWQICRDKGYGVVADVHVHPAGYEQSRSDKAEPAMPQPNHFAIIIPDFAAKAVEPGGIGIYEYLGDGRWATHTKQGPAVFRLE